MRGVLRRAQGPCVRAVRPRVRVRGVCGAADQDENPDVSRVPPRHPGDDEGVLLIAGLELDEFQPSTSGGTRVVSTTRRGGRGVCGCFSLQARQPHRRRVARCPASRRHVIVHTLPPTSLTTTRDGLPRRCCLPTRRRATPRSSTISRIGPAPSETAPQAAAPTVRWSWWEGNPNAE